MESFGFLELFCGICVGISSSRKDHYLLSACYNTDNIDHLDQICVGFVELQMKVFVVHLGYVWFDRMKSDRNEMKARTTLKWNKVGIVIHIPVFWLCIRISLE